tara:strand:+ start:245 stop:505 length:261 start_codon:yes stop_codon:yes gene_type:complete
VKDYKVKSTFFWSSATPNAMTLVRFQRIGKAGLNEWAAFAQRLCHFGRGGSQLRINNVLWEERSWQLFARHSTLIVYKFEQAHVAT